MFKAVIFDMDGVIIDSEPFHDLVNRELFRRLGIVVADIDYRAYIGTSHTHMWSDLKGRHGLPHSVADLVEMQVKGNEAYLVAHAFEPIAGIVPLLSTLRGKGIPLGLASSSSMATIELVLQKLKLAAYFTEIISGEAFVRGKPEPDIFLHAAKRLGVDPSFCLVVEDSYNGVRAAKAAGMTCIGFQNPSTGQEDLTAADVIVQGLTDLTWEVLVEISGTPY